MKLLRYALYAVGGLILLLGIVLAYVAATFDPNRHKPQIVLAVKEKTQRTLKLEGDIKLSFWPGIGAKVGKASLSERGSEREFAAVEEVRIHLKVLPLLSGQAVVDKVLIKGLRANIVKTKDGRSSVDDLAGPPAKEAPSKDAGRGLQVDIAGVEVTDAAIGYTDQAAGSKYTLSKLNLKTGRIAPGVPTRIELTFNARGDGLDLQTALKTLLKFDPGRSVNLDDLEVEANGVAAGMSKVALRLSGGAAVDIAKERAQLQLAGKVIDSNVKARIEVAGFAAPAIRFDFETDQLDLDRLLGVAKPGAAAQKAPPQKETPFDLSGLRDLNAAGTLKIGALKANNVRVTNVSAEVKAKGGRVNLDPLRADFYQGKLASAIAINALPATPTFAVKHNMSAVNIGPLLKDVADSDLLEGKGDITADVTTQGNTVSAMKSALDGSAALKLADGSLNGIDIAGSIRDAKARVGTRKDDEAQAADKRQKTDFSELTATFKIANGIARNNDLAMKSPLLRVGGEGEINIGADTLNYLVRASIVGTVKGQGGREVEELRGVTVPVRVAGPLTAPKYKVDYRALVSGTAKQKLEGQVQDRLKGLLGR